jgi:hypothetical protein
LRWLKINKFKRALAANQQARTGEPWSAIQADILPSTAGGENEMIFCPQCAANYDGETVEGEVKDDTVIWNTKWNPGCF